MIKREMVGPYYLPHIYDNDDPLFALGEQLILVSWLCATLIEMGIQGRHSKTKVKIPRYKLDAFDSIIYGATA